MKDPITSETTDWTIANLLEGGLKDVQISGSPTLADSPYGKAVYFDGVDDAIFLEQMPLKSLTEFTVEMIFSPDPNGAFEQRVVHMGEISDDRMLLEIRAIDSNWYFDGFVASRENKLALIDESLLHPLGQWFHVALIVTANSLTTYVNGELELSKANIFKAIENGRSSLGVRLNERSWFHGKIYKIRVTPKKIKPADFMTPVSK